MHVVELVVGHASGFIERTVDRVVVDSNKPCHDFSKKARKCAKQFSDRKTKEKMEMYTAFCSTNLGCTPTKIPLPNKTRVAGNFRMYEGLARNHYAIERYCFHMSRMTTKPKGFVPKHYLDPTEWQQLAEYCAIYEKMTSLLMQYQADSVGILSIAKLLLANFIVEIGGASPMGKLLWFGFYMVSGLGVSLYYTLLFYTAPPPIDEATPWDPFEVDDTTVLFEVVVVNDPTCVFHPTIPYADLARQTMCLPLKVTAPPPGAAGVQAAGQVVQAEEGLTLGFGQWKDWLRSDR